MDQAALIAYIPNIDRPTIIASRQDMQIMKNTPKQDAGKGTNESNGTVDKGNAKPASASPSDLILELPAEVQNAISVLQKAVKSIPQNQVIGITRQILGTDGVMEVLTTACSGLHYTELANLSFPSDFCFVTDYPWPIHPEIVQQKMVSFREFKIPTWSASCNGFMRHSNYRGVAQNEGKLCEVCLELAYNQQLLGILREVRLGAVISFFELYLTNVYLFNFLFYN